MKSIAAILCGLAVVALANPAQGAIFFDLKGSGGIQDEINLNADLVDLKVTGHLVSGGDAKVYQYIYPSTPAFGGVGVYNPGDPTDIIDMGSRGKWANVDGAGGAEFIRLAFSTEVSITRIVFTDITTLDPSYMYDRLGLRVDGVEQDLVSLFGTDLIQNMAPFGDGGMIVDFVNGIPAGHVFEFFARNPNDSWKIEKLWVETPEPLGFIVWSLLGVSLFFMVRRKRTQKSE